MKIKVLLLKDVAGLWWKWELKEVSDSYARNVLIKQNMAKIADKKTINSYNKSMQDKQNKEKELEIKKVEVLNELKEKWLFLNVSISPSWKLYEKIDSKTIKDFILEQYNVKFKDKEISLPEKKISNVWVYEFFIKKDWNDLKIQLNILIK